MGEALRLLRVFDGKTARELAKFLDISPNYLSEIEKGKKPPTLDMLGEYAKFYNLRRSDIVKMQEEIDLIPATASRKIRIARKLISMLEATN